MASEFNPSDDHLEDTIKPEDVPANLIGVQRGPLHQHKVEGCSLESNANGPGHKC